MQCATKLQLSRWTTYYYRGLRNLAGYRAMPILVAALRTHSPEFNRAKRGVDKTWNAA
jgi:hypothetical protein